MIVGVAKEIKEFENRVAAVPAGVNAFVADGHEVLVEEGAGVGVGLDDEAFRAEGARVVDRATLFGEAEMILKVKEPLPSEYSLITDRHTVFTYFHFAASRELTDAMTASGAVCVAYETIERNGTLPLLTPMSEVAGKMASQEGAKYLERPQGGLGILLGGVAGVEPATVVIIGGGIVGISAARVAAGMGARVVILDVDVDRLRYLEDVMPKNV
ncbi:MAG: alanine dehydrogenase, partial [Planctomycetota bacterium JB042]